MSRNTKKMSRRLAALLWLFGAAIVIGFLIYIEQIAMLYLLATISLVVLMLVVAFADLENVDREDLEGFAGIRE
jgi:heme A synthase